MSAREEEAFAIIEASERHQHFTDVRHVTVRWEPYKKDGQRQMKAKGRWQEQVGSGDYWSWQNCDRPEFAHDSQADYTQDDMDRAVRAAREDALREAADLFDNDPCCEDTDGASAKRRILALLDRTAEGEA